MYLLVAITLLGEKEKDEVTRRGENLNPREVGERVKRARLEADGMTQRELADFLGVTERTVAAVERGEWIPYRHMSKIETVLQRPASWFLYGESHPQMDPSIARLEEKLDRVIQLLEAIQPPPQRGRQS